MKPSIFSLSYTKIKLCNSFPNFIRGISISSKYIINDFLLFQINDNELLIDKYTF